MSLSRDFSTFVAALNYDALPPEVIDRAKGVTLQALSSALVAHDMPASRQALALMQEEEAGSAGIASALCSGVKLTKAGAAFVNAEMILAGGKWDTFRMLTHPGTAILPAALVAAEPLHPVHTATTVRVRNGQAALYDGPFAETKELLAGFYLIDAKDLNDALHIAGRIPPAKYGSIEVRPVRELSVAGYHAFSPQAPPR
jgi:hypothetical protein